MSYITTQPKRIKNENNEWVESGDFETIVRDYAIVRKFKEN